MTEDLIERLEALIGRYNFDQEELIREAITALREQERAIENETIIRTGYKARIEELEISTIHNKWRSAMARIDELETKVQLQLNYIKRLQIESIEDKTDE